VTEGQPRQDPAAERLVALAFGVTMVTGLALLVVYVLGGQTQVEGVLLFLCLGGLGAGIVLWAHRLLPNDERVEERDPPPPPAQAAALAETLGAEGGFTRRTMLKRLLVGAFAGLGAALAIPVFSLGPAPGRSLFETPWRAGLRLVDEHNEPIRVDDVPLGGIRTVFPEGTPGSGDGQSVLVHVEPELLRLPPDRAAWAPEGFVCYSKICTHAGCPVGLYRAEQHALICPCHQSTFDVLAGATPTYGPAVRPLPQLPIQLQPDGTFVALDDFPEPVGPSFWDVSQG
jgi:ubiquinol-cytochrome c reductase iron-sulfur subunit